MIKIITTYGLNNEIGLNNKLLCNQKSDMEMFKTKTSGHVIVMGRKMYESIGKPLPNIINVVLTKDMNYKMKGVIVLHSKQAVIDYINQFKQDAYIIGGTSIYELFIDVAEQIDVTLINSSFKTDYFFPLFNTNEYDIINTINHKKDKDNDYDYSFRSYKKK